MAILAANIRRPLFGRDALTKAEYMIVLELVDRSTREIRADKEIAYVTGRSVQTIKLHLFRGRKKLEATRFGLAVRVLNGEFDEETLKC